MNYILLISMIADIITFSRIILSLLMLIFPAESRSFLALYLLCGISDAADGFTARITHTESERGAKLDSAADLVFAAVYAVKIIPGLGIPLLMWIWIAVIAAVRIAGIILRYMRSGEIALPHSPSNRITGLMIFLLPLARPAAGTGCCVAAACVAATGAALSEIMETAERQDTK